MARTNGSAARGRQVNSPESTDSPEPGAPASTQPGPGQRGLRLSEMVDTEYRLLGAQLRAGRMPEAVRTSRRLTDLVQSLRNLQPPAGARTNTARATPKPSKTAQPRKNNRRTDTPN
ncbi:hypothetical protein GCM10027456_33150 [Kineosporia babensis]